MKFDVLLLSTYMLRIALSSWTTESFIIMQFPSLSLITFLPLKSVLPKINMDALTFFWLVFRSDQISRSVVSDSLRPHELQHARPRCPSPTPRVHWDSRPSSQWCHPAISFSVVPFSSCPQSLPASESFPMSQLFTWGGQSTGVSALASFLPKNTQDWSPLGWTSWISLQSKGLWRVFSNTTVKKHQFFGAQLSSQSNSHIHTNIYSWITLLYTGNYHNIVNQLYFD